MREWYRKEFYLNIPPVLFPFLFALGKKPRKWYNWIDCKLLERESYATCFYYRKSWASGSIWRF